MQTVYDSYKKLLIILILPAIGLLFFLFINLTSASINQEINFQGKIVNKIDGTNLINGTPACVKAGADTCDFQVRIYSDPVGGTPLWTETFTDIELGSTGGVFNLSIGSYCITDQGGSWTSDGDGPGNRCTVSNGGITWGFDPTLYIEIKFDTSDTVGLNAFTTPETFSRKLLTTVPSAFSSTYAQNLVVSLTNNSGQTLNSGTLVISDVTQDNSFTTTTTSNDIRVMGVLVTNNCTNGAVCQIQVAGSTTVNAETGITRGQYLYASAQEGKVKGQSVQSGNGFIGTALSNESSGQLTILINTSASGSSAATTGSGSSTVEEQSLAPGEFIEIEHNLNSSDITTQSWIFDTTTGQYRLISGDSSGFDSFVGSDTRIGGYWRMEESGSPLFDNSINVNPLLQGANSTTLFAQTGRFGKGLGLNGLNDFIYASDQTFYNPTSLSVGGWFKLDKTFSPNSNANGQDAVLIDKGDYSLKLNNQTGKAEFSINDSSTAANIFNASQNLAFSDRVYTLQEYKGYLYSGHGVQANDGDIYICDPAIVGDTDVCTAGDWSLSFSDAIYENIFHLTVFNGKLYASAGVSTGDGDVLVCDPAATGDTMKCDQGDWSLAFDGVQEAILQLAEFNGFLYASQGNGAGDGDLFICDPSISGDTTVCDTGDWSISYDSANTAIRVLKQFQDRFYFGLDGTGGDIYMCNPATTGNILKCDPGDWVLSRDNTIYNGVTAFAEFNGYLYAGFYTGAGHQDLYVCNPSSTGNINECENADWTFIYNGPQESVLSLTVANGRLLQGIGNTAATDSDVYACTPGTTGDKLLCDSGDWTVILDGANDQIDSIYEYKGRIYIGTGASAGLGDIFYYEENLILESTNTNWAADTWYHIVGVYDPIAVEMRLYVNGVKTDTKSTSTIVSLQDSAANLIIGTGSSRGAGQTSSYFDGKIDEVFLAGRVLSDSEILQVYNSSTSAYPVIQVNTNTVRLYNLGSTTEVLKLIVGPGSGGSGSGNSFEKEETVANNSYLEINHFVGSTSLQATAYVKQGDLYKVIDVSANLDAGDGSDGNLSPSGTFNLNTNASGSRSYADGIAYRVAPPERGDTVIARQSTSYNLNNGIAAGDEVLVINLQGSSGDITDVGNYEIRTVTASSSGSITIGTPLRYSYNGTTPASQKVIIQRVPNYANVTLDGTDKLTASDWDGLVTLPTGGAGFYTGIVAFKASGIVNIGATASIDTTELGYRGGDCGTCANTEAGRQGESRVGLGGTSTSASDNGGGGAPGTDAVGGSAGAGGGYGTVGGNSTNNGAASALGGSIIGDNQLNQVFFGGGGGGPGDNNGTFGKGGDGGGIILIYTNGITGSGAIESLGENGDNEVGGIGQGGGGAGGTVLIHSRNTETGLDINASGGTGGTGDDIAGAGGDGRIAVYFVSQNLSTYNPNPYEEILGGAFFEIVNPNTNTTRLFNFSGESRVLKLVLSTGAGGSGTAINANQFIKFRPETAQESGDTSNPLIYLNENGTGSANLIQLQVGGIDTFVVDNTGDLTIAGGDITGANGINIDLGEENIGAVTINGNLLPSVDNTYDLGSSSLRWKDGYFGGSVHIGDGSLVLTDDYIRDTNGALVLQSNGNDEDFIYLSQTTLSGATTPGIFWSGVQNYTNDPGIRVNPITGKLEFRDSDQDSWSQFDSFLSISNEYTFSGTTTVGTPNQQVDFTVYGDIITGGNTKTNEALAPGGANTAMFVYNTFLDKDTGSWRTSTSSKNSSWYNETKDDASVTCSESSHDRCGRSEFPSVAAIIATTSDLYIMDSTRDTMWMKFDLTNTYPIPLTTINEIYAKEGKVYLATNIGVIIIDFRNDSFVKYDSTGSNSNGNNIGNRNSASTYILVNDAFKIASNTVTDVDVTEISGVVYIAVGTLLGAEIINTSYTDTYEYVGVGGATGTATADDATVGSGPWDAFDISNPGQYLSLANDSTAVLTYQFVQPTRVDRYIIQCGAAVGRCPEDWTLQGSNDGTFTDNAGGPFILDTRGPITMVIETAYTYDVANPGTYNYIRFNITDVLQADPTNNLVNIRDIRMFHRKKVPAVRKYAIESTLKSLVVSSQLNNTTASWRRLVDNHQNTFYVSQAGDVAPVIQMRLRNPTAVTQYSVTGYDLTTYTATSAIRDWLFQGSNDGVNWTTLNTQSAQTFAFEFERKTYTFANTTSYQYYRLRVTRNNGNLTNTTLREFEVQGPVITASSQANATTASAQNLAFQGEDDANYTWQGTTATNEWVKYDYGSQNAPITTSYSLNLDSAAANVPNAWLFQGSNAASPNTGRNHSDWTTLDTRSVTLSAYNRHTFTFSNSTGYRHYRVFIDTTQGGVVPQIAGLEIGEERIISYQENVALEEYRISDNDTNTDWRSEELINIEAGISTYIEKDFGAGNQRVVNAMILDLRANVTFDVADWVLTASNDRSTWTTLAHDVDHTVVASKTYVIDNQTAYRHYRLTISSVNTLNNAALIDEWDLITGQPTEVEFGNNGDFYITDEENQALLFYKTTQNDTGKLDNLPNQQIDIQGTVSINEPPKTGGTVLNYTNSRVYYGGKDGLDIFEYSPSKSAVERVRRMDDSVVGDFTTLYTFDGGTIATPATLEQIRDTSGNKAFPVSMSGSPDFVAGKVNDTALDFDNATNDYIIVPDEQFDSFAGDFSAGAWIYNDPLDTAATQQSIMGTFLAASNGWYLYLDITTRELRFYNGATIYPSTYNVTPGEWVHVAVTFNTGVLKFYVNGSMVREIEANNTTDGGDFYIGSRGPSSPATLDFDGYIDDVFTNDKILTQEEIQDIMTREKNWYLDGIQATSGNSSSITSNGAGFTSNAFQNQLIEIVSGAGAGQTRTITSNTASIVSITPNWSINPDATSVFKIREFSLPGIENILSVSTGESQTLIGTNNGSDGGGAIFFKNNASRYRLKQVNYYHGASGKIDTAGNIWKTTYDDIVGIESVQNKLHILSDKHYWVESQSESLKEKVEQLEQNALNVVDSTGTTQSRQVIRTGWGFIEGNNTPLINQIVDFGINFTSPPTVLTTGIGYNTTSPNSISECSLTTYEQLTHAQILNNASFTLLMRTVYQYENTGGTFVQTTYLANNYYCFNWMAIGEFEGGGADLAENYFTRDLTLEAGDVIGIDYLNDISVVKTKSAYDRSAIGIVATKPAIVLGPANGTTPGVPTSITGNEVAQGEGKVVPVALAGRVPVKVTLENGPIKRGDFLTPASKPGYAMKATKPGITIGRALENYTGGLTIIDTDKTLAELDKLVELGEIDFKANELISKLERDEDGNLNVNQKSALAELAALKLSSSLSQPEGKVMAFVQTGYYWGDSSDTQTKIPTATQEESVNDNVDNTTVDENTDSKDLTDENVKPINIQDGTQFDITKYITPQADDANIGSFTLGRLIIRQESNSINSVGDKLRFQTISQEPIEFYGGSILFDKFGNIITLGSIRADSIFVNQIFVDKATGEALIQPGAKDIYIENPYVSEDSTIFITSNKFITYRIKSVDAGKGFHVELSSPPDEEVRIKYLFIN